MNFKQYLKNEELLNKKAKCLNGIIIVDGYISSDNVHIIIKTCPVCGMVHLHGNCDYEIGDTAHVSPHCAVSYKHFNFKIKIVGTISRSEERKLVNRMNPAKELPDIEMENGYIENNFFKSKAEIEEQYKNIFNEGYLSSIPENVRKKLFKLAIKNNFDFEQTYKKFVEFEQEIRERGYRKISEDPDEGVKDTGYYYCILAKVEYYLVSYEGENNG